MNFMQLDNVIFFPTGIKRRHLWDVSRKPAWWPADTPFRSPNAQPKFNVFDLDRILESCCVYVAARFGSRQVVNEQEGEEEDEEGMDCSDGTGESRQAGENGNGGMEDVVNGGNGESQAGGTRMYDAGMIDSEEGTDGAVYEEVVEEIAESVDDEQDRVTAVDLVRIEVDRNMCKVRFHCILTYI